MVTQITKTIYPRKNNSKVACSCRINNYPSISNNRHKYRKVRNKLAIKIHLPYLSH